MKIRPRITLVRFNANNGNGWWWYIVIKFPHHRPIWLAEAYKTKGLAEEAVAKL